MKKVLITASIVLYKEDLSVLKKTINSFLSFKEPKLLYLIDNTPSSNYKNLFKDNDIVYIENKKNIGFGSAHNKILPFIKNVSDYHLILNPDVSFNSEILSELISQLQNDHTLAMIAPKVLFLDETHQYSCRRYPKVLELIARRFSLIRPFFSKQLKYGIYKDKNLDEPFYCQYLTGCFQLYNTNDFLALDGFDERYFLYMEDVDICKKIDQLNKRKLYYPKVEINHILKQGSLRKLNLFLRHLTSAFKYYLKWGI